ncbi:TPA: hypothetical protein I7721_22690, partial [Vibrio vulnificus]|nr:hypothetical protein [Vibrio vulnificus]
SPAYSIGAGAAVAAESELTVTPDSITANNTDKSAITLTLKDKYLNDVKSATVGFTSDLAGVTFEAVTNNEDGTYSSSLKGKLAGKAIVGVRVGNKAFAVTGKTVTLTADSSTARLTNPGAGVSVVTTGAVADGESENSVKVTVT